ncbi:hypothetical protein QO001_005047 [Methylobacterium brachiatum]|uniref:Uncharacterized protein n=1 Tax=Methylobacterium brachiatum TaxID=269660 RepID=A0AAJ1TYM7_9HYPH|nr:hypothetical protein [Methylobacterium brachiatum]MCB4805157.1 hypothetical protein [Methylobacterium brachiatum]MDQ0546098.1 hypothetical protein [Methylobacterium brachiatum]
MTSTPFAARPSRTVGVVLDDLTLDAVDLIRLADPSEPSRSKVLRDLIQFALAMVLDPAAADAFVAEHIGQDDDHATTPLKDAVPAGRA